MFGTRIRSWMEAHIVRARKKQSRSKNKSKGLEAPQLAISDEKSNEVKHSVPKDNSTYSVGKTEVNGVHLSSPESAYSTGYSTDGTSPGASVPPEYYINLRTGKHYVQATGNTAVSGGVGPEGRSTPGRRRREETKRRREDGLPGSSTEEDIADRAAKTTPQPRIITPKVQRKVITCEVPTFHRRTESYDDSQHQNFFAEISSRDSEGSSSTHTTGPTLQCSSPFLSASPRQRNRIRTNPWLGAEKSKAYNSQGETSSTVGSSSTLSSTGCKERPPPTIPEEVKNLNLLRNSGTYIASPLINGRRVMHTVTTCSPQPNRPCHHIRPTTSSSSTSARSSGSDDNHHGNTSDFSDDDVTLNEMLGKYDESYVYEKETDILSDSDPTDCEDQPDYNGKFVNRGHCTFVSSANHTPEMCKRQCSRLRRQRGESSTHSSRGSSLCNRRMRRSSSRRSEDLNAEVTPKRYRRKRQSSKDSRKSIESLPKDPPPVPMRTFKPPQISEVEKKILEPGRHLNLNRVLMERLIQNQRSGTRSADGTPVSLRRNGTEYNGKYLKNPHVSKLISSNSNIVERRSQVDEKRIDTHETATIKKRSNSLTACPVNPPVVPSRSFGKEVTELDREGDIRYRKLIQEAEHIFEDFQGRSQPDYLSPTLSTRSAIFPAPRPHVYPFHRIPNEAEINSQIDLLQETINNNSVPKIENEEGIFKTISKTLEKIIIRNNSGLKKAEKINDSLKLKKKESNKINSFNGCALSIFNASETNNITQENDYVNNPIPIPINTFPDPNDNLYKDNYRYNLYSNENAVTINQNSMTNYNKGSLAKKGLDIMRGNESPYNTSNKIGHINRNNKAKDLSSSWHGRRTIAEIHNGNEETVKTPLNSFKSFDLGNQVDANVKYCPQSEPVKRKVYVCSSTFDKLQKSLRKSSERHYEVPDLPTEALRDENTSLKEKVAQLRKERLQVEARVRETQEQIDRLRLAEASSHC
ncbi:uncharacterized protein [Halyomorpha halys]|uniref:uncharacterized protein isoform X2 n=1 Tax=Halyomorpha halys TaxID=286706 RepID=UPI0006D4D37B|nr:uncharacterized protein LOC106686911 isoform X2 [Halyomorpha halys]